MAEEPRGLALTLLFIQWVTVVYEPHWYAAAKGPDVVLKLPLILFASIVVILAIGVPITESWQRRWQWYAPLLAYIAVCAVMVPFAPNIGYARMSLQTIVLWWGMIAATGAIVDSPRRAEFLLKMYAFAFLWWAVWGLRFGLVQWHYSLSNYDGFGAFNVGGFGICYFLAMGATNRKLKYIMYAIAALCAMGVVASFARGAFLALTIVLFTIWLRSPHKGRTFLAMAGAVVVIVAAASLLFDEGFFWNEIMSVFEEGTTEGTGEDRMILWGAGWRVFTEHPFLGSGLRNWGVVAASLFQPGELPGDYANPGRLYTMNLHNVWLTILAETGIIGSLAFLWILIDFWRRNKALRTPEAEARWHAMGGTLKLRPVALGLEASMIAFIFNSIIYAMMSLHWFWTMLGLNFLLHSLVINQAPRRARTRGK
ncbi:MAG TPA: O-antigen ligase family protein [Longimicrobiales bacterium]